MAVSMPTKSAASNAPCPVRGRLFRAIWRRVKDVSLSLHIISCHAGMSVQTMFCHRDRSIEGAKANRRRIAVHIPPAMPIFFDASGVMSSVMRRWRPYAPRAHSAKAKRKAIMPGARNTLTPGTM